MLGINPKDRVHFFIDGQNLYGTLRSLQKKMDYRNLVEVFKENCRLVHANYFTTIKDNADDRFYGVLDFLEVNGYTVVSKEVRQHTDDRGNVRFRGSMVGDITASMVATACDTRDHLVLFSGDGELVAGVEIAKQRGSRVTVVSDPSVISDELKRACDEFVLITDLPPHVLIGEDEEFSR